MNEKIKKLLAILFVVLFVATLTASAVSADEVKRCGNEPLRFGPHGPIHEIKGIVSVHNEISTGDVLEIASMKQATC
jgi:hypothetical protein